jgi:hypothetical protein
VACGGEGGIPTPEGPGPGGAYPSVEELYAVMDDRGAGCREDTTHHGIIPGVDTLVCHSTGPGSDGSKYVLALRHTSAWPKDTGALGVEVASRVEGANWYVLVFTGNDEQLTRIQSALGGTIHRA